MRNWSIFSDNVRYVQHDQATPQNLSIDILDYRDHKELYLKLKEEERETIDSDFGLYPDITKSRYLDNLIKPLILLNLCLSNILYVQNH